MRSATGELTGGRASPPVDELSSLATKCTFTVKRRSPEVVSQAAARGLRLSSHTGLVGSMRPGLKLWGQSNQFVVSIVHSSQLTYLRVTSPPDLTGSVASSAPPAGDPEINDNFSGRQLESDQYEFHLKACTEPLQVGLANVAALLTTILIVDGINIDEVVCRTTRGLDGIDEVTEGQVRADDSVIRRARVILDLLQEHDIRAVQEVGNVVGDRVQELIGRREVVNLYDHEPHEIIASETMRGTYVVISDRDGARASTVLDGRSWNVVAGVRLDSRSCKRKNVVETESGGFSC